MLSLTAKEFLSLRRTFSFLFPVCTRPYATLWGSRLLHLFSYNIFENHFVFQRRILQGTPDIFQAPDVALYVGRDSGNYMKGSVDEVWDLLCSSYYSVDKGVNM